MYTCYQNKIVALVCGAEILMEYNGKFINRPNNI